MIRYRLTMPESEYPRPPKDLPAEWLERIPKPPTVVISLDVDDPNGWGPLVFESKNEPFLWEIQIEVSGSTGLWGHSFDPEATTPVDLRHALCTGYMKRFGAVLLEGQEILDRFVSDIEEIEGSGRVR